MDKTLVILAAGMGSRYGGLKQLDKVGPDGQTIMDYSIYDAIEAGFNKIVFIIRKDFQDAFDDMIISKYKDKVNCVTVFQETDAFTGDIPKDVIEKREKPWGTGHAILVAKNVIDEPFAAINADDFYGKDAFVQMAKFLSENADNASTYSMVGYPLVNTLSEHGSVNRGICKVDGERNLLSIFEGLKIARKNGSAVHFTNETEEKLELEVPVSMNFWGFHPSILDFLEEDFIRFGKETADDPRSEYFIPFVVNTMMMEKGISVKVLPTESKWIGVTYKEDKEFVQKDIAQLTQKGIYPAKF
ncbi:MAG: NDP-sugar pyrophosphorylase family protein [Patiriisocius sp.]|jgi:NDP-sugar pyrophosphorylase family protein